MAVNYAEQYSTVLDERFTLTSRTDAAVNQDFDFEGANTVKVYSVPSKPLVDYDMNAADNRYGVPEELANNIQTLTLTQDKAFTFTIDKRNYTDTMGTQAAGIALAREINEIIIPTVHKYRINVMCEHAGAVLNQAITSENAYSSFLAASQVLTNCKVPTDGRTVFVSPEFYAALKLDSNFTGKADKVQELAKNGVVAFVDGISVVLVPVDYLPEGVNYVITQQVWQPRRRPKLQTIIYRIVRKALTAGSWKAVSIMTPLC